MAVPPSVLTTYNGYVPPLFAGAVNVIDVLLTTVTTPAYDPLTITDAPVIKPLPVKVIV
jgi:hypothetical protein